MKFIYPFGDISKSCYYLIIRYNLSGDNLETHTHARTDHEIYGYNKSRQQIYELLLESSA